MSSNSDYELAKQGAQGSFDQLEQNLAMLATANDQKIATLARQKAPIDAMIRAEERALINNFEELRVLSRRRRQGIADFKARRGGRTRTSARLQSLARKAVAEEMKVLFVKRERIKDVIAGLRAMWVGFEEQIAEIREQNDGIMVEREGWSRERAGFVDELQDIPFEPVGSEIEGDV